MLLELMKFLLQCPCSGGSAIHPVLLLAIVAAIWLLAKWIKSVFRKEGVSLMNKIGKIVIVIVLIAAITVVIVVKQRHKANTTPTINENTTFNTTEENTTPTTEVGQTKALPRLIDLGADKCIPCKMMAPILEELKKEYAGRLQVDFIDVWKNPEEAERYGIKLIPTQIFFDASGKERFRHEGFISKEDILGKWKELGIELEKGTNNETN
jgi:thioredoxin 1